MLIARGVDGEVGILGGHAPLLVQLAIGPLRMIRRRRRLAQGRGRRRVPARVHARGRTRASTCSRRHAELAEEIDSEAARGAARGARGPRRPRTTHEVAAGEIAQGARPGSSWSAAPAAADLDRYDRAMDRLLVTGGARLAGTVQIVGREELRAEAHGGVVAGARPLRDHATCRGSSDCAVMAEMLGTPRALAVRPVTGASRARRDDVDGVEAPHELVAADACLDRGPRAAARAMRRGARRDARR